MGNISGLSRRGGSLSLEKTFPAAKQAVEEFFPTLFTVELDGGTIRFNPVHPEDKGKAFFEWHQHNRCKVGGKEAHGLGYIGEWAHALIKNRTAEILGGNARIFSEGVDDPPWLPDSSKYRSFWSYLCTPRRGSWEYMVGLLRFQVGEALYVRPKGLSFEQLLEGVPEWAMEDRDTPIPPEEPWFTD